MPSCAAMAPIAQHRGGDAQLACDLDQRPTAARQQGDRLPLELIRKMTPFLTHSTPFRSRRSLAKVSTNSGEAHLPERKRQFSQPPLDPIRLDVRKILAINPRRALVGAALSIGMRQNIVAADLVVQGVEAIAGLRLSFRV